MRAAWLHTKQVTRHCQSMPTVSHTITATAYTAARLHISERHCCLWHEAFRISEACWTFCLREVASPLARQYYFIGLFLPLTVLMHRAADDARPRVRIGTWALIGTAFALMLLSLPIFPVALQAWLWATLIPPRSTRIRSGWVRRFWLAALEHLSYRGS